MGRAFSAATAEQVVAVVDAVSAFGTPTSVGQISEFTDMSEAVIEKAVRLAEDLGLLATGNDGVETCSVLSRYFSVPDGAAKAAALRLVLEDYEPFDAFRRRLRSGETAEKAAQQVVALFDLESDKHSVRDTLISLGTYTQALMNQGGGAYSVEDDPPADALAEMMNVASTRAGSGGILEKELTIEFLELLPSSSVIEPLKSGLVHAADRKSREAILQAGNAVESFLLWFGNQVGEDVSTKPGINARIDALANASKLCKKHKNVGKYLGHMRNAADHGEDTDVAAAWEFDPTSGSQYVAVAIAFMRSCLLRQQNSQHIL